MYLLNILYHLLVDVYKTMYQPFDVQISFIFHLLESLNDVIFFMALVDCNLFWPYIVNYVGISQ